MPLISEFGSGPSAQPAHHAVLSQLLRLSTMDPKPQRQKGRDRVLSSLNVAIEALNLAKDAAGIAPAQAAFSSVSALLTMIRDSMANKISYVDLGLACANVCTALDRGMDGRKLDDLSQSVREAIAQLTITVAEIQEKVIEKRGRNMVSQFFHAKDDKETIAGWNADLNRVLQVFTTELVVNTHVMVSDLHRNALIGQGDNARHRSNQASIPSGEQPPSAPRACFGRKELIETVVGLAENLTPIALIGPGGIGKTSIALTILHHDRIKQRFGDNRRFVRCDQFSASLTRFLSRLSKVVGAGVENPEDLTHLRPFLSSREMILVLDNAESILDPQGTDAREIYTVVEELSRLKTICLCITSRISTVPRHCKRPTIQTLSTESACDIFYSIYNNGTRSVVIDNLLKRLDFHALSITLLATAASHNVWDYDQLAQEWNARRTQVLRTDYNESLAATVELSLASPMFQKLGPSARDLLSIVAFFPQGINRNNLEWLFPTIPNRRDIFDKFCTLSLTYQSNGFITMHAPLRDYLCPEDPMASPSLCATRNRYFRRLSVDLYPDKPGYEEAGWITSEDANAEHLLDVFTSIDVNSVDVWAACHHFMEHLYWHKPRLVALWPKIEGLSDDHPSKPQCLFALSLLFYMVGNYPEEKRLLIRTVKIWRERGDNTQVARALVFLAEVNGHLGLEREGTEQAREALELYERLNDIPGQGHALGCLAGLLQHDSQLGAAEEAASRAINILDKGDQYRVEECHTILGDIYHSKGETEKAISHYETALRIATSFNWPVEQSSNHYRLARMFHHLADFDGADAHVKHAKSYAINIPFDLGLAMRLQARIWYRQCKFEEAKLEALDAADIFEKIGAVGEVEECRYILRRIERKMKRPITSGEFNSDARGIRHHPASLS